MIASLVLSAALALGSYAVPAGLSSAVAEPAAAAPNTIAGQPLAADDYVATVVEAWHDTPVYVSPQSGALSPEDADQLVRRIDGWRDDVHIAVLPAIALGSSPGGSDPERARAFIAAAADALGPDGVYVVAFGGVGTYGAAVGTHDEVGPIMARQVEKHTLGQLDQTLNGVLDELGAPRSEDDGGMPWGWVGLGIAVVAVGGVGVLLWRRRSGLRQTRDSGEVWAGPAPYRPSFRVQADEHDTVEERAALAREDVTRLGERIDDEDLPTTDPAVAAHVQAGLDAYHDASRRVDALTTDDELRQLKETTDYARWQLDCARARLDGVAPPPRRATCFIDPEHGRSVADWSWAPPGGVERPVPVCHDCLTRMSGGES
ncbi:hypothetical protein ncot_01875 [Nocardioides sp. JQ2195]|uniref:hypothetical protein n=1 Tax=Nocardioides sp. JQ2195 TaxID=2592334 RepID=UPI00143E5578|nr:hypothetical protein [Nocardioides sp. JQ2195]QIX25473.1 hypothetical protein ncot_01875 [Nocardioides sp. JQ2195]